MRTLVKTLAVTMIAGLNPGLTPAQEKSKGEKIELFGSTKLWTYHLEITARDWKAMQPTKGGQPFDPTKKKDDKPFPSPKGDKPFGPGLPRSVLVVRK